MMSQKTSRCCLPVSVLCALLVMGTGFSAYGVEGDAAPSAPAPGAPPGESISPTSTASTPEDYTIQIDDVLTVDGGQHSKYLDPRRSYRVAKDGTIKLPFLDRVKAAGLTKRELEDRLEKQYDPKYFKDLCITVEVASKTFYIGGEVRSPGIRPLAVRLSLLAAVLSAGGFTDYADLDNVRVSRLQSGNWVVQTVDCKAILRGKAPDDFEIKPNDLIWVPRGGIFK